MHPSSQAIKTELFTMNRSGKSNCYFRWNARYVLEEAIAGFASQKPRPEEPIPPFGQGNLEVQIHVLQKGFTEGGSRSFVMDDREKISF